MSRTADVGDFKVPAPPNSLGRHFLVLQAAVVLLVLLATAVGLGWHFYGAAASKPPHEAVAQIMVIRKVPVDSSGDDAVHRRTESEDSIATQMLLIRSPYVVKLAVKKLEQDGRLSTMKTFVGPDRPETVLAKSLQVNRAAPGTPILALSFGGPDAEECIAILNAVVAAYQEFVEAHYNSADKESTELMNSARKIMSEDLRKLQEESAQLRQERPLAWPGKSTGPSLPETHLSQLDSRRFALQLRRTELEKQIETLEVAAKEQPRRLAITLLVAEWSARSGYDKLPAEVKKDVEPLQANIACLKQELEDNRTTDAALERLFAREEAEARSLTTWEVQDEEMRSRITMARQLYDEQIKKLQTMQLAGGGSSYLVTVIAPPASKR